MRRPCSGHGDRTQWSPSMSSPCSMLPRPKGGRTWGGRRVGCRSSNYLSKQLFGLINSAFTLFLFASPVKISSPFNRTQKNSGKQHGKRSTGLFSNYLFVHVCMHARVHEGALTVHTCVGATASSHMVPGGRILVHGLS